jgi:hypothetical protein
MAVCAAGCGDGGTTADPPVDLDRCALTIDVGSGGVPIDGGLAIGLESDDTFAPLVDGGMVELVMGAQGGWMITPTLRVDGDAMLGGEPCPIAIFDSAVAEGGPTLSQTMPLLFVRQGEGEPWYSSVVPLFLSLDVDELEGKSASFGVTIDNGTMSAEVVVGDLVLRNDG